MSAEEFWKDDPQLFVSYRTSFINKKKREVEETDYKSWLVGLYSHIGNGLLFDSLKQFFINILAGFTKTPKNVEKIGEYPKKPLFELEKETQTTLKEKPKEKTEHEKFQDDLVYFGTLKKQYLEKLSKKGE